MSEPKAPTVAPTPSTPVAGRPRVLVAAVEGHRRGAVVREANRVVAHGGSVVFVTADGGRRSPGLADAVRVIDLAAAERRVGLNRAITRDPARLVRRLRGLPVSGPAPLWARVSRSKPYRLVRPWLLWRALRRHLDEVQVGDLDHVIIVHQNSWPVAWQLHRRNPAVTISYEVPDTVWERCGRPVPPAEPQGPSI